MKKIYLLLLILPLFGFSQQNFWSKTDANRISSAKLVERNSTPVDADIYQLDFENLKYALNASISRFSNEDSNVIIKFPNAKGQLDDYQIYRASVMEAELAARHPEIQSYVGINLNSPGTTIRFSTTIFGFHGMIMTIGKTFYIDPYTNDLSTYSFYAKENLYSDIERIGCQLTDEMTTRTSDLEYNTLDLRNANDGLLRTFRLALASTQEYSNYHINQAGLQAGTDVQKKAAVLAAMNVSMTRVNGIYERDMSLTMNIISNNEDIIFLVENDGYTNDDGVAMLSQNQSIIDNVIGGANYDMGHVFSTGGGGVASLGGVCFSNAKARAVTGLTAPVGDVFDVDFVAHEMGHHLGANHSYNGGDGNCGGERNPSTAVEPGSGNTIMGYAGICANDNVQPNSDANFHAISIDEMYARITSCPPPITVSTSPNGNVAPISNAGIDYTIPYGTAFSLTGIGSDPDGGTISYSWEQVDAGNSTDQPNTTSTANPQFRSFPPTSNPERIFPQLENILNDNLTPQWEVIPNVARNMDFALTVRDNQSPNGGQTNRDDMRVTVANTGPFRVTAPDMTNASFPSGSSTTITWDVAGTTANGINTSNVNILLSTDGGQNFNTSLASNIGNDGSESVTFPSGLQETNCRIKIEPVGNIYFAISKSFSIGVEVTTDCNTYTTGPISTPIPDGTGTTAPGQGPAVFVPINVSETTAITDIRLSVDVTHSFVGDLLMQLQEPDGSDISNVWSGNCGGNANIDITFKDGEAPINCDSPTVGLANPVNPLSVFNGSNPSGEWNLAFVDFFAGDVGTVNEVVIELCSTTTTVLSNDDFQLNDFALFPNPSNGDFTLQFNSKSGKDINVDVYDISGKLVFNNNYDGTSRFDKQIELNNVSTGIYIMKVNDGDKTITRKLIIE